VARSKAVMALDIGRQGMSVPVNPEATGAKGRKANAWFEFLW